MVNHQSQPLSNGEPPAPPLVRPGNSGGFDVLLGFSEGAACASLLVAAMTGTGKATVVVNSASSVVNG